MPETLTPEERAFLARSAEFQRLLADDPVLAALDAENFDHDAEVAEVFECLGAPTHIGNFSVRPLTLAKWSLLWCLGNNFVLDETRITPLDVDVFLYVLHCEVAVDPRELELLPARASGCCDRAGVDVEVAAGQLLQLTRRAFSPLHFLPRAAGGDEAPKLRFDAEWMTFMASVAVRESGHTMYHVLYRMPLATVLFCLVNHLRRRDDKGIIYRHTGEAAAVRILERVNELGAEFCRRHHI